MSLICRSRTQFFFVHLSDSISGLFRSFMFLFHQYCKKCLSIFSVCEFPSSTPWSLNHLIKNFMDHSNCYKSKLSLSFFSFQKLDFKYPLSVSCVHFICSAFGGYMVIKVLKLKPLITVDPGDRWKRIFPMSLVFCINIVLGNVSLRYIPVSFMQTIKSFTPATTGKVQ